MTNKDLAELSDNELIVHLRSVYRRSQECTADLIRILVVVHDRRLHLKTAHPSLNEFCIRQLGMCNSSASRYSTATKLVVQFPRLLGRIEQGQLHVSTLLLMRHHLTPQNVDELVERAHGRTSYQVKELLASVAPRPDAPSRMRKLPTPRKVQSVTPLERGLEPLAPERYRVQFNADRETHDDILQARDLMSHSNPSGDLDKIMKFCVRAGVERLEARQRGLLRKRPSRSVDRRRTPTSRHVPRAVRRAVFERDGAQCTFHDEAGSRCSSKTLLELDHIDPYAVGGVHEVDNLRVRCRPHNSYYAEQYYGEAFIAERIRARQAEVGASSAPMRDDALAESAAAGASTKSNAASTARTAENARAGYDGETATKAKGVKKAKEPRPPKARGSSDAFGSAVG